MFKRFLRMGLKDKVTPPANKAAGGTDLLTDKEAAFVIVKLRQAQYTGAEFEQFYLIMSKLQEVVEKKST
jgi:hypothetical protein